MTIADIFAAFDADAEALNPTLDPAIYVEPTDRGDASEEARQFAFKTFMQENCRRVLVAAFTNGTHIASKAGRAKANREGRYKGMPDMEVVWAGGHAYLEWKAGRGSPSDAQIDCLNRLAAMEHPVAIVRTVDGAMRWLGDQGAPVPAVR